MTDGLRVLYVDDEPELLEMAKIFLEMDGEFSVGISTSAKEVISLPLTRSYDAIVSDYEMPGMNGIAFLKYVREQFGDIPFILFTGRGREEVVIDAINNGADFYLQKGGSARAQFAELAHKIRQAVVKRRAQAELREAYNRITASEEELARSEQQLQESEGKFRDFADHLPQMVFETDMDLRITYVNKYTIASYGFTAEAVGSGLSILTFIHPSQHATFMESVHHLRYGIPFAPKEYIAFDKEQKPFPVIVYSSPIFRNKRMIGFRGVVMDISGRKRAERELRESEEKHRTFAELLPQIVFETDMDLRLTFVNKRAYSQFGYTMEEVAAGFDALKIIAPSQHARLKQNMANLVHGVPYTNEEYTLIRKDGTTLLGLVYASPVYRDGQLAGYRGIIIDISERKQAEEALRESEEKFRLLVENASDIVFSLDRAGNFTYISPQWSEILGHNTRALIGTPSTALIHPDDLPKNVRAFHSVMDKGTRVHGIEYRVRHRDGTWRWHSQSAAPIQNASGEVVAYQGICHDITERKQAEEALRESEAHYRLLADNVSDVIWTADTEMRLTYLSPSIRKLRGMSPQEAMAEPIQDAMTPESLAVLREHRKTIMETLNRGAPVPEPRPMELEFRRKDGSTVWTEVLITPTFAPDGTPTGVVGITRDISKRRTSEQAVRESENKFATIFRTSLVALTLLSMKDNTFFDVNEAFVKNTGYSHDDVIGKTPWEIGLLVDRENEKQIASILKNEGHIEAAEVPFRAKDGTIQICLYSATLITMQGELFLLSSVIDISERKNIEEALRQANRKLNILSGITRHDINNQLQVLGGYVALLHQKVRDPVHASDFSRISKTIGQISSLIQFTREYEMIGVHEPIWQRVRELVFSAGKSALPDSIRLTCDLPDQLEIYADPLISKVFFNLMDNARRHGETIHEIRFSLEEKNGNDIIVCSDDGDGVPQAEKERIFAPGVGKNTGFGLTLSREILDITGISIQETGTEGNGARFEITVPTGKHRMGVSQ